MGGKGGGGFIDSAPVCIGQDLDYGGGGGCNPNAASSMSLETAGGRLMSVCGKVGNSVLGSMCMMDTLEGICNRLSRPG